MEIDDEEVTGSLSCCAAGTYPMHNGSHGVFDQGECAVIGTTHNQVPRYVAKLPAVVVDGNIVIVV